MENKQRYKIGDIIELMESQLTEKLLCTKCNIEKPLTREYFNFSKGKRRLPCKSCVTITKNNSPKRAAWLANNREYQLAYRIKWYHEKGFNRDLIKQYGITEEDFNRMVEEQSGVCAICSKKETVKGGRLSVDHDHITGKVRGLLCTLCNTALGKLGDSIEGLQKAIDYLKKHKGNQ